MRKHRKHAIGVLILISVLFRVDKNRSLIKRFNKLGKFLTPWQITLLTILGTYITRRWLVITGVDGPSDGIQYKMSFYRAAWIFQIFDCGFWTAREIEPKFLRDFMSIVFCVYFLIYPGKANEMHSRYRRHFTIDIIRNSWEKALHPLFRLVNGLHTPSIVMKRDLIIPRKNNLGVEAVLYFDGTEDELSSCNKMIFHIPGGGFVCLSPENYNDVLCIMAKKTRKPVLAIKYRKAPEFPFPEGLEECFDVYEKIIKTEGRIIGMKSVESIKMSGDSAGANLVCAVIFMAMERKMRLPDATCLMCPLLTFDVEGWLTSENQNILSNHVPNHFPTKASQGFLVSKELEKIHLSKIEVTSRFKFFNDMILTPEYLLGMALMYLRKYPKAEPAKDHLLSPLNAPEEFLKQFPPTFIQIGDKDPLVDDSLLFYSKLKNFDKSVQLELLEGISHGYLNMLGLLPEGRIAVDNVCSYLK